MLQFSTAARARSSVVFVKMVRCLRLGLVQLPSPSAFLRERASPGAVTLGSNARPARRPVVWHDCDSWVVLSGTGIRPFVALVRSLTCIWLTAGVCLAVTGAVASARAAEGAPDPSFGSGGIATYELGLGTSRRRSDLFDLAVPAEGKIYAVGVSRDEPNAVTLLVRITPDGALDPSFGEEGLVRGALPLGESAG
jgi:Domain of unknown function (DUF5122) beta-propeller